MELQPLHLNHGSVCMHEGSSAACVRFVVSGTMPVSLPKGKSSPLDHATTVNRTGMAPQLQPGTM